MTTRVRIAVLASTVAVSTPFHAFARLCSHPDPANPGSVVTAECPPLPPLPPDAAGGGAAATVTTNQLANTFERDVTYMERLPKLFNYCIAWAGWGPTTFCAPEQAAEQRWPTVGQTVTWRVHVVNKGGQPAPATTVTWLADNAFVGSTVLPAIAPGGEVTGDFQRAWPAVPQTLVAEVAQSDVLPANNRLSVRTDALALWMWVERELYDQFNSRQSLFTGTYSYEDWVNRTLEWMNTRTLAPYPIVAPQGVRDQMRLDRVTVIAEPIDPLEGGPWPAADKRQPDGT